MYQRKGISFTYWQQRQYRFWRKFKTSESIEIITKDINDLETTDDYIFIGTVNGLLRHNIDRLTHSNITPSATSSVPNWSNKWDRIDNSNGLNDNAVWKIEKYNNRIFVGTIRGINEIDTESFVVIPDKFNNLSIKSGSL